MWEMGSSNGAYDKAAIKCNGREAVTNFELSTYGEMILDADNGAVAQQGSIPRVAFLSQLKAGKLGELGFLLKSEICDFFVYIPQYGCGIASLNVTGAASIVLHHFGDSAPAISVVLHSFVIAGLLATPLAVSILALSATKLVALGDQTRKLSFSVIMSQQQSISSC